MNTPRTYAEWLPLLDRFRSGDDSDIQTMQNGSIEWTNVVAERWTRQVADALAARLQALSTNLQTGLNRARGDYFAVSNGLLAARRGLAPLRSFVALPCFPEMVRSHLASELDRWVTQTQNSLEKSAMEVRHDQGQLLKTIRDNPLNAVVADKPGTATDQAEESLPPTQRRRVIL